MGQWIATLSKSHQERNPKIDIKEDIIGSISKVDGNLNGLSEKQRKEIWDAIIKAQDRAESDAEEKYPMNSNHPNYWSGNTFLEEKFKEISYKHIDYKKTLMLKYEEEVRTQFKITEAIADSITSEGMKENWAFPE